MNISAVDQGKTAEKFLNIRAAQPAPSLSSVADDLKRAYRRGIVSSTDNYSLIMYLALGIIMILGLIQFAKNRG